MLHWRLLTLMVGLGNVVFLSGCAQHRDDRPAARPPERTETVEVSPPEPSRPPAPRAAESPATATEPPSAPSSAHSAPPTPPPAPPPEPSKRSDYITVLDRYHGDAPFATNTQVEPPHRLKVDTDNVRRLRIDRRRVPLAQAGSIALIIDGQGFEWGEKTTLLTLERTTSGAWEVAREPAP